jgi:ATP-dependent DNA helicase RecQ
VGAHDLDDFRSLRLFRHDGSYLEDDANLEIGDVWELSYVERPGAVAPHLEDVLVLRSGARRIGREADLAALVAARDIIWHSVDELFEGHLNFTAPGSAYVPEAGPLPSRSTGYWQPADELTLYHVNDKPRYRWTGGGALRSIRYVGLADPEPMIPAGSLVRLSLSHPFAPPDGPRGYWLQLSGWFPQ